MPYLFHTNFDLLSKAIFFMDVIDRTIDAIFMIDIIINFYTVYKDPHTDEEVKSFKKIAIRYVTRGRFFIDLFASIPIELITSFGISKSINLKFIGLVKMIRLLRLGRMITFLKTNQGLKLSMKIGQLIFFLLLAMHWVAWFWYFITSFSKTWFPSKDIDSAKTIVYSEENNFVIYLIYFYYSIVFITGSEVLPSNNYELITAWFFIWIGTIMMGLIIGEIASLFSSMSNKERAINEEIDTVNLVMLNLKIPEPIQSRVLTYYNTMIESRFIRNNAFYKVISSKLEKKIRYYQLIHSTEMLKFLNSTNESQIERFLKNVDISLFLEGDIIIKQGFTNDYLYFIIDGLAEVFIENSDFAFYDYFSVSKYISRPKNDEAQSQDLKEHMECQINIETVNQGLLEKKEEPQEDNSFSYLINVKLANNGNYFSFDFFLSKITSNLVQPEDNPIVKIDDDECKSSERIYQKSPNNQMKRSKFK